MNRIYTVIISFILLAFSQADDSSSIPIGYFRMPIEGVIRLSGTFGELRPQHFHAGIDIKGYVGQPIRASAEGYISRIKISPEGYGKVLYISHPNGYTSVYAHLSQFTAEVEQYIKTAQYEQKAYAIDLRPAINHFLFKKGEQIAKMGVTGRSYGPHVHFEIRETTSDRALNPLLFDLFAKDTRPPNLQRLKIIPIDKRGNTWPGNSYDLKRTRNARYQLSTNKDTIEVRNAQTGIALQAYDQLDAAPNKNDLYELMLYQDDKLQFHLKMDSLSLPQLRYSNAHLDYQNWWSTGDCFHRCFRLVGDNQKAVYVKDQGIVVLDEGQTAHIQIKARDIAGNTSDLSFWLKRREEKFKLSKAPPYYFLPHHLANGINSSGLQVAFPKGTFYQDIFFQQDATYEHSDNVYSLVQHLNDPSTPIHDYFELAIQAIRDMPKHLKTKAFIAYCSKTQQLVNCGGVWEKDWLHTKARVLGDFHIAIDEIPPMIKPMNFKRNMQREREVVFLIRDEVATAPNIRGLTYEGFIDGQWVLFTYNPKSNRITHQFEQDLARGEHTLLLKVRDAVGNESIFERSFIR